MPWHIAKSDECPPDKPWAVLKSGTDEKVACHESREAAQKQVAALYANEPDTGASKAGAVKATVLDGGTLRLLALPFGGPIPNRNYAKGMDLDHEWFSERTDFKADWLDVRLVDWHHGADDDLQREVIGKASNLEFDEDGGWVELWLEHGRKSVDRLRRLVESGGRLFGSSETLARLIRKDSDTGEILEWPYLRQTLTTSPVNHLSVVTGKAVVEGLTPSVSFWTELPAYLASGLPVGQHGVHVEAERVGQMLDDSLAPWNAAGGHPR